MSSNSELSSKFYWLRSVNHVKFTEECMICTEKHVLVKNIFTNEVNMSLQLQIEQRSVIKYLLAEKCKTCEKYRICDVYGKACFSQTISTYGLNMGLPLLA